MTTKYIGADVDSKMTELAVRRKGQVVARRRVTTFISDTHGNKSGNWLVCSPKTGNRFCAVGVYFARKVHMETGIPIGIVKAAWGGTRIEPWITPKGCASVTEIPPVGKLPATYKINPYPASPFCTDDWLMK